MEGQGLLVVVNLIVAALASVLVAAAQGPRSLRPSHATSDAGTGFTCLGQLKRRGRPVNASCDSVFALCDAAGAGTQIGGIILTTFDFAAAHGHAPART